MAIPRALTGIAVGVICALVAGAAATAAAETITRNLPLVGLSLNYGDEDVSTPFNLGVQFSRIDTIAVEVVGQGVDGVYKHIHSDGSFFEGSFSPPLAIFLPGDGSTTTPGDFGHLVRGEHLSWSAEFGPPISTILLDCFDHLLDGEGQLRLSSRDNFVTIGFDRIEIPQPSHIDLTSATITVTGVLVPEPSAVWLGLFAAAGLGVWKRLAVSD